MLRDQRRHTALSRPDHGERPPALYLARMFSSAGAHMEAHAILLRELDRLPPDPDETAPSGPQAGEAVPDLDPARDPELEPDLLSLLLESCCVLGHEEHLALWSARLRRLCGHDSPVGPRALVAARSVLVRVLTIQGRYREALEECAGLPPGLLESAPAADSVRFLSRWKEAHFRLGELDEAEAITARALRLAEQDGDPALQGNVWGLMAAIQRVRGRFSQALHMYGEAARLHQRGGDYTGLARDDLNRGWLFNRMGLLAESVEGFENARRHAAAAGVEDLRVRAELGLGMAAARRGECREARRRLLRVWRRARRLAMRREAVLALEFLAEASILEGRYAPARAALSLCRREAHRLASSGDVMLECTVREGMLALFEGDCERAEERCRSALDLATEGGMPWEGAQALRLLGAALVAQGRREEGQAALRAAEQSLEGLGEVFEILLVRSWIEFSEGKAPRDGGHEGRVAELAALYKLPGFHPSILLAQPAPERDAYAPAPKPGGAASSTGARSTPKRARRSAPGSGGPDPVWAKLGLVTETPRMLRVLSDARAVAQAGDAVLILGETGTGKDLLARGIHELSGRRGLFLPFSCAACPVELVESELFGAERGAFTGADRRREGLAVKAAGGTLFLDEIGDLPGRAQGSVLRFLDQGEVRALGSHVIRRLHLGIVAATHHSLYCQVERGAFRRDLYYRLAQKVLEVPPLRDRGQDMPLLIAMLWSRLTDGSEAPSWLSDESTLETLKTHPWPGNVRELEHFLRRVRMLSPSGMTPGEIQRDLRAPLARPDPPSSQSPRTAVGESDLDRALSATKGNRVQAAALLGISRAKLYRLLREYGKG